MKDKKSKLKFYRDRNKFQSLRVWHLSRIIEKKQLGMLLRKFLRKRYSFDFYYKAMEEFSELEDGREYPKEACVFSPSRVLEELKAIKEVLNMHKEEFIMYDLEDKEGIVFSKDMFYNNWLYKKS